VRRERGTRWVACYRGPVEIEQLRSLLGAQKDLAVTRLEVALLFGSMARGRARPDSDVDLAVFGDVDPLALSGALSALLRREVDVVRIEGAPIPLLDSIVRDGKVVFERVPGAAATLRSRLLASLEVDRAWYARMQRAFLARVAERGILG
jgi:predicted nucleotidyltransferase